MAVTQKVLIPQEDYEYLLLNSEEIYDYAFNCAIKANYHPSGYGFFSPRISKDGEDHYIKWERFASCD